MWPRYREHKEIQILNGQGKAKYRKGRDKGEVI